jgi:arsenate reductase
LVYAKAEGLKIQEIDILKTKLTGTQLVELAGKLNMMIADLVNLAHPTYSSYCEPQNFSTDDWIKLIQHNPEIMKQPIALKGTKTILVETPTDVIKIKKTLLDFFIE